MNKALIGAVAFGALVVGSDNIRAASTDVDAIVEVTRTAIAITSLAPLNFGTFEITADTAEGTIAIDLNNQVTTTTSNLIYNDGHSQGRFRTTGTPLAIVQYTCTSDAFLVHETDPTQTMQVNNVGIGLQLCTASAELRTARISANGIREDTVWGELTFNSPIPGSYSTGFPGGTPITIDVIYQ